MRRVIDFRERAIHVQQIEDVRLRRLVLLRTLLESMANHILGLRFPNGLTSFPNIMTMLL